MSSSDKYTDPELREEIKEEVKQGDKGGQPGQWSARKAQMMASEYKKRGGAYTTSEDHKDTQQKHLDNWTAEEWQTSDGSGNAKQADGTETRYLPKEAWDHMSEKEKEETNEKKMEASKEGQQYVSNTAEAKQARKNAMKGEENAEMERPVPALHKQDSVHSNEGSQSEMAAEREGKSESEVREQMNEPGTKEQMNEPETKEQQNESEVKGSADKVETKEIDDQGEPATVVPKKRGSATDQHGANKKQKGVSQKEGPRGTPGDKSRVPQTGQKVQWHTISGYVDGEVVEVAYESKTVEGKPVKGKKDDPRVVLKSASTGKIAVHRPQAIFFE